MSALIQEYVDVSVKIAGAVPDRFSFGTYLGVFDHSVTANRIDGPYASVAEAASAGFTSIAAPEVVHWLTAVFAQDDGVDSVLIGRQDAGDADWTDTMDAIEAYAEANGISWYGHTIESRVEADILDVAAWTEARFHMFIPQSGDAAFKDGTPGNVGEDLQAAGYRRTAGALYRAVGSGAPNGYADGAWASSGFGMNLDAPNGRGIWAYRVLEGITFDNLTSAEATNIFNVDGNIYGRNKGLSFTSKGTLAAGAPYFIDIQTSIDWIKTRIEEDILALFVAQNVVPFTNAGIQLIVSTVKQRLDQGVLFGHFSGDPGNEPTVVAPDVNTISSADKQARELSLTATAVFAGAVQRLTLVIDLAF